MKKILYFLVPLFAINAANAAVVVATVNGKPVTDTDITARTQLMARQGKNATDNRRQALQNIIDDSVKLEYASKFGAVPSDSDVDAELKRMNLGDLGASEREMARNAVRANIAWQVIVARTIMPTVEITNDDIKSEKTSLEREHGLPIEMTLVRLIDVPNDIAKKLTKPKNCEDAMDMARRFGGEPQKFTALQYELAPDIRESVAGLQTMDWSKPTKNGSMFLICETKKTKEYGKLDDVIKQNAIYKQSMFIADQQLKQLRRRAIVVINDDRYKI
ncbi:MAG: hypothetical protein J6Y07_01955 [Alphaproteobacteria bacterium]|nr:hypothetical protein [Alphaproteobacteria bacterium]